MLCCTEKHFQEAQLMSHHYSESFKQEVIAQFESGNTAKSICEKYGIARSTLFLWKKERIADDHGRIPRELYLQLQELDRLRMENSI